MNYNSTFNFSSNISYLCPRDQSLRPGGLPQPKNLLFQFGEADKETEDVVKVYLRIKPRDEVAGKLYTAVDDRKLYVDHPRESTSSHKSDHARRYSEQFVFTKILTGGVDQSQVFKECTLQPVKNFIQGDNCLVFAYGTTNAGKTFTIRGDARNPGIIPRALDFVFSSLGDRVLDEPSLLLVQGSHLEQLSDSGTTVLLNYKHMMLEGGLDHYKSSDRKLTSTLSVHSDTSSEASMMFHDMEAQMRQDLLPESSMSVPDGQARYLVYVSFAEIYNENIYDLLQLSNTRQAYGWRRTPLQLGLDTRGNTYIKDLQHFQVTSGYEAYRIMLFGQHNLRMAGTELNSISSRSHCIFNIKLVKCTDSFENVDISTFSFCDLAGSERAKKTHNCGDRMKESQNINTSLLVLGRCLKTIRANQQSKEKLPVPFRDSKLTRLFKEPLLRKGCVSIIVNINLDPYLYDETVNVLKFSAIAREVVLPPRRKKKPPARMSLFAQHLQKRRQTVRESSVDGSIASVGDIRDASLANADLLVKLVERLQAELSQERANSACLAQQLRAKQLECAAVERNFAQREDNLRKELVHDFQDCLKDLVERGEASRQSMEYRLEDMANFRIRIAERKYANKLDKLKRQLKKRKLQVEDDVEELDECGEEGGGVDERLRECEEQLAASQQEVLGLQAERDTLRATVKVQSQQANVLQERVSRLELQLKVATAAAKEGGVSTEDDPLSSLQKQLEELTAKKASLEEQVKLLTATVDSAAEDHEEILEEKNKLEQECHALDKKLAEKELEVSELTSRVDTYQATFSKQSQELDLLQKVAHDRLESLEEGKKYVSELELRIQELTLSEKDGKSLLKELADRNAEAEEKLAQAEGCKAHESETLQREIKELLQRVLALEASVREKDAELKGLQHDLKTEITAGMNCKKEVEALKEELRKREHDMAVKDAVMKDRIEQLQIENAGLRDSCAQLEMEKEKQLRQHESLFKAYEDCLKKKTDEMERYKRDAQHCHDLLYRNTPTPNKETQEVIKGLRDELRRKDDQMVGLERQVEEMKIRSVGKDARLESPQSERREASPLCDHDENRQPSKSTSKKNPRANTKTTHSRARSVRGAASVSESKPPPSPVAKPKTRSRKQLFTMNDSIVDVDDNKREPSHFKAKESKKKQSPNTFLKRSLRAKP